MTSFFQTGKDLNNRVIPAKAGIHLDALTHTVTRAGGEPA